MPIDSSIYFQQQAPDIVGSIERGLNMRQLIDQRRKQRDVEDAYKSGVVTNPDGSTTFDNTKTLSALAKADPKQAMEFQRESQTLEAQKQKLQQEKHMHAIDMFARIAPSMKDQASYEAGLQTLTKAGVDVSDAPRAYEPSLVDRYHSMAITAKDQQELQNKDRDFQAKRAELGLKHDENNIKRSQVSNEKVDKLLKDMKNDLDADKGRSGNFGTISAKVQQADRLQTLVSSYKNGDLPPQQMEELALGLANMLSGTSGAARAQVEALVPHTWWGGKQSVQQYLMNEPLGSGQQKFVEAMAHTIDREKQTANSQLNNIRASRLAAHEHLKKMAPDQYNNLLNSYGIDATKIKDGKYQSDPAKSGPTQQMAGQIVNVKGKRYRVGADGDSLEEITTQTAGR